MTDHALTKSWLDQLPFDKVSECLPVNGGDINWAYYLRADDKEYFMKVQPNKTKKYFKHELDGLQTMNKVVNVPRPITSGQIDNDAYLILEWLQVGNGDQYELGQEVAKLHHQTNDLFGFYENHQTKALVKNNSWNPDWCDFYVNQRLRPEIQTAIKHGCWNDRRQKHFDRMVSQFMGYYSHHNIVPSLLHGDLWAGNFLFTNEHSPYLIDPDCIYGDREFDLAMTTIFSGFNSAFYRGYNDNYPLEPGFEDRLPWYQFYYLCMHLILFGESYGPAIDRILGRY